MVLLIEAYGGNTKSNGFVTTKVWHENIKFHSFIVAVRVPYLGHDYLGGWRSFVFKKTVDACCKNVFLHRVTLNKK